MLHVQNVWNGKLNLIKSQMASKHFWGEKMTWVLISAYITDFPKFPKIFLTFYLKSKFFFVHF